MNGCGACPGFGGGGSNRELFPSATLNQLPCARASNLQNQQVRACDVELPDLPGTHDDFELLVVAGTFHVIKLYAFVEVPRCSIPFVRHLDRDAIQAPLVSGDAAVVIIHEDTRYRFNYEFQYSHGGGCVMRWGL